MADFAPHSGAGIGVVCDQLGNQYPAGGQGQLQGDLSGHLLFSDTNGALFCATEFDYKYHDPVGVHVLHGNLFGLTALVTGSCVFGNYGGASVYGAQDHRLCDPFRVYDCHPCLFGVAGLLDLPANGHICQYRHHGTAQEVTVMQKRIIALCLLACLLLSACAPATVRNDYKSVRPENSGSDRYTLAVNPETCNVSVLDKQGNVVLSTNPEDPQEDEFTPPAALNNLRSQLLVSYYSELNVDSTVGSYLSSVKKGSFTVTQKNDACVRIDYDFSRKDEQFIIPVEYRLEGDCLQVRVLTDEIVEYGTKRINSIAVTPYLLRGTAQEGGYLLLPDGSGATVDFTYANPDAAAYSAQIYGHNGAEALYYEEGNPKSVLLPVFGADYVDHSVLARVDSNAAAGWINARAMGSFCSFAHAYASFDYRVFDTVTIAGNDWQFKEYVAASDLVETEDFAVSYHIIAEGGLHALAEKCIETAETAPHAPTEPLSAVLYAYGATEQREAFLGIPYTKTVVATSLADVSGMLNVLGASERSLAVLLQDFDKAALDEQYPGEVKWSADCGGAKGYEALHSSYPNTAVYCVENLLYEPASSFIWAKQGHFAKMVSRQNLARYDYSPVTYAYTASDLYGLKLSWLINEAGTALDKAGCTIAMRYSGSELYSDCSSTDGSTRSAYQREITALLAQKASNNAIEGGNEYALGLGAMNYNIPVFSSGYGMQTQSVPFLQMVYHGNAMLVSAKLNLTEDPQKELLGCIASGTVPCFAVTQMANEDLRRSEYKDLFGTGFAGQQARILELLERTEDYYNAIYNRRIVSYEMHDGVSTTVFEGGIRVIVNFNRETVQHEGEPIKPMDFKIVC